MKENKIKIGLAFSGGGFRASAFNLGVLSYLNAVELNKEPLLKKVIALSTTSGGTISGTRYAIGIKKNESFDQIYSSLYKFMNDVDLVNTSLSKLISKKDKNGKRINNLINAFADVYDDKLFDKELFGTLLDDNNPIHLKHISFNATEFANALQFRFQKTEKIKETIGDEPDSGIIGNYYYRIPENVAKDIRMADILAASSCFPGGFEPINFPDDFNLPVSGEYSDFFNNNNLPVGLMDGGIVDNQGIEPLLLAEERMKRNRYNETGKKNDSNIFDLLIISDVASPYMEDYKASKRHKKGFWGRLTPIQIMVANSIILAGSLTGLIYSLKYDLLCYGVIFSSVATLNIIVFILSRFIIRLPKTFHVPQAFINAFRKLLKIRLAVYENMITNRVSSMLKMTNSVFLKHIRRLNYNRIYNDKSWKNRRVMNAIYELRKGEEKLQNKIVKGTLDENLIPTKAIQDVASTAAGMSTTLWFTEKERKKDNMLDCLIATGEFTMCWNLAEYISQIKKNTENTNEHHKDLIKCESQILKHWEMFKKDPFWMVNNSKKGVNQ